jgi:DNA-directed RNA polymerase omega subunit
MDYVTAEELIGKARNKYEAVVVAALRARQLNRLEKKIRVAESTGEEEGEEEEMVRKRRKKKVTVMALQELIGGKIDYQQEEG